MVSLTDNETNQTTKQPTGKPNPSHIPAILWLLFIPLCTEVSGVENIGQCGRLSQLRWLLGTL